MNNEIYRIGDVYNINFCGVGSVQKGWRPGLIIQNNIGNKHSPNVIVLPLTKTAKKKCMPTHVLIEAKNRFRHDSTVLCENPQTASKSQIGRFIATLSIEELKRVAVGFSISTPTIGFLDKDELMNLWTECRRG